VTVFATVSATRYVSEFAILFGTVFVTQCGSVFAKPSETESDSRCALVFD